MKKKNLYDTAMHCFVEMLCRWSEEKSLRLEKQVRDAFNKDNSHDITKVILKLAKELALYGADFSAHHLLNVALESPYAKQEYHRFFSHKTCKEKLLEARNSLEKKYPSCNLDWIYS